MNTADGQRTYWTFEPASPRALVVALHPLSWTATDFDAYIGFDGYAASQGYRVLYPQGLRKAWNAGYCCPAFNTGKVDDGAFLTALIAASTEPGWKVFLLGFSNGAMMAYRMACLLPHVISAIGVVGSDGEQCSPAPPLPAVLHFQGTADDETGNRLWVSRDGKWINAGIKATDWWTSLGADVHLVRVSGGIHDWYHHDPDASAEIAQFFAQRT
jgi:poly(3-hydroxybutyrate) depolymerase